MFNVFLNLKKITFSSRHNILSIKSIYIATLLICSYLFIMDCILIHELKHRKPLPLTKYNLKNSLFSNDFLKNNITEETTKTQREKSLFYPLPVKKAMIADTTMFIRSPIAEFIENHLRFSYFFPFVTANMVSFTHNVISIISIRFLADDSLIWRQFGVCLFQFRNFLDSFDGVIYRAHSKKNAYKSNYGSFGYFVDATSDTLGGICLTIAILIYLCKHRPLQKINTRLLDSNVNNSKYVEENTGFFRKLFMALTNTEAGYDFKSTKIDSSYLYTQLNNIDLEKNDDNKKELNQEKTLQNKLVPKLNIISAVIMLGIRLGISAIFWDQNVHTYQDLFDITPKTKFHQEMQLLISKSDLSIIIMFCWRYMSALFLQDLILYAIFIDKIWEFIVLSHYYGWLSLISLIIITHFHTSEISTILSNVSLRML